MAYDTGISSAVAQYVYTQSNGAVTEPIGGSYLQAYCEYLGATTLVGNSWLITLCDHFGITEPLNGSWTIALANYYSLTYPTGGTWWQALAEAGGAPPVIELIWNETTSFWNETNVNWATDLTPPDAPVWTGQTFPVGVYTPTITGTAEPLSTITLTADAQVYTGQTDVLGDWSVQITNPLAGELSPGIGYLVSVTATDLAGNVSPATDDYIYIVAPDEITLTVDMFDTYGDGWTRNTFQLQQEIAPGVWEPIEYNENPFAFATLQQWLDYETSGSMEGATYYKESPWVGYDSGIYGVRFERYEPGALPGGGSTGWKELLGARSWTVPAIGNYRTVAQNLGSFTSEPSYTIKQGSTEIVSFAGGNNTTWTPGYVQTTFTLS